MNRIARNIHRTALLIGCALFLLASVFAPCSAAGREAAPLIDTTLNRCLAQDGAANAQEWLSGALAEKAAASGAWYAMALRKYLPELDFAVYTRAAEAEAEKAEGSPAARLKLAMALMASGSDRMELVQTILRETAGAGGVMGRIYTLHVLNSAGGDAGDAIEALLQAQLPDGGWAVTGSVSDVDVTAMALQALAPSYGKTPAVTEAADRALELLSARQKENGGFASMGGESCESAAQVVVALTSLGIDPDADERFLKNGQSPLDAMLAYRLPEGGFAHQAGGAENATATLQAFYALVSVQCRENGPLWVFDGTAVHGSAAAEGLTFRAWAYIAIAAAALLGCLVLLLLGRRSVKSYAAVLLAALALVAVNTFVEFSAPQDYYGTSAVKGETVGTVTLSVRCDTVAGRAEHIPSDGVILAAEVPVCAGDTALSVLQQAAREASVPLEVQGGYVRGIRYLYEFDFGNLSGWMYYVNGQAPSVYSGEFAITPGDTVEWLYTTDLGNDLQR